jgi:hypothetical protein
VPTAMYLFHFMVVADQLSSIGRMCTVGKTIYSRLDRLEKFVRMTTRDTLCYWHYCVADSLDANVDKRHDTENHLFPNNLSFRLVT